MILDKWQHNKTRNIHRNIHRNNIKPFLQSTRQGAGMLFKKIKMNETGLGQVAADSPVPTNRRAPKAQRRGFLCDTLTQLTPFSKSDKALLQLDCALKVWHQLYGECSTTVPLLTSEMVVPPPSFF